jgi:hypothetical protein
VPLNFLYLNINLTAIFHIHMTAKICHKLVDRFGFYVLNITA